METQLRVQPPSPIPVPLPTSLTGAGAEVNQDEQPPRIDKKDETPAVDREIYDNVACTD